MARKRRTRITLRAALTRLLVTAVIVAERWLARLA